MGKALAETSDVARRTFEEADTALGYSLSKLLFEGPEDELKRTEITQPALMAAGIAAYRALISRRPELAFKVAAGHSLGEWTALVATGAMRFEDGLRLVRARGRFMQEAVPAGVGAMSAVLGMEPEKVRAICAEVEAGLGGELVRPANFNSAEQTVISGHAGAVAKAAEALKAAGAMKCVPLAVSAPFHCPLMGPAADRLAEALAPIEIMTPSVPVVSNVEATPNSDPHKIKALLVSQMTAPVRWIEVTQAIVKLGTTSAVELGAGKVLAGLVRRIDKNLKLSSIEDPASLDKALETLG